MDYKKFMESYYGGKHRSAAWHADGGGNDERHDLDTHLHTNKPAGTPHAVHINGKKWKSFSSQSHAQNVANKIKGATVHKEEVEMEEGLDIIARADYKVGATGKKSHKEIVFHNGDTSQEKDDKLKREDYEMQEEKMTDAEMKERERLVKGMKKGMAGFKAKYGERAKEVMYATATKKAMQEDAELEEGINDNLHPAGAALLKHIKPEHRNKYKAHLTTDTFNGSYKDRTDVLNAAKKAGHLKEDAEQIDEISTAQMGHAGKTTIKHIKNPTVTQRMAAHDVKPGIKGYRDRIDLLKAAKAQGNLKEASKDESEYGYEGDMALNQLATLTRCAEMIKDMLKPDTDMPEWVQSKITLATDYIQTAADYMYSEVNEELKGKQHKLDKNKNGKLDAHDFKLLRKEESELDEAFVNAREYASHGLMHPTHAAHAVHKVTGSTIDFYAHGSGDKVSGKVTKNDGKAVHIKDTKGTTHKFKVTPNLPKQQNEEVDLEENAPVAPSLMKHRISVTVSDPDHTMVSKRKEKMQKTVVVTHSSNKEGAQKVGEKFYKKKGFIVHDSHHAGMVNEEVELDENHLMDYRRYTQAAKNAHNKGDHDIAKDAEQKASKAAANYTKVTGKKPTFNEEVVNEESTAYEKSEENKRSADSAKKQGDMFAHHLHMSDHHENLAQWHSEKGRHGEADKHAEKAEQHHEKAMALKESVNFDDEGNLMAEKKTYSQFMEQLLEYESDTGGVYRHTKKATYGTSYQGDDDEEKPKKPAPTGEKRGRGRPAGSKSGANQKVSSGKSYGGIAVHSLNLPK